MEARGATVRAARLFDGAAVPKSQDFDWLIIMGGPMSVNDESQHAWLGPEKRMVAAAAASGKVVLGICLGAQLIASALGARVYRNHAKEIGWFPVSRVSSSDSGPSRLFPANAEVFHWHGETFDLPSGATRFLESDACANQAFSIGGNVVGLQFHLETTPESAGLLIENCRDEIKPCPTIQSGQEMLARPERFTAINGLMDSVLTYLGGLSETAASRPAP